MSVKPNTAIQTQGTRAEPPVSQERKEALLKLIQVEPDHLSGLVHATGWGEDQTRMALLQLTVDGLVRRHNRSGRQYFEAVHRIDSQTVSHA